MWVSYLDESSQNEKDYLSMAAILCHGSSLEKLSLAIDFVIERAVVEYQIDPNSELHVTDMLSKVNGWEKLPGPGAALEIAKWAVEAICEIEKLHFVTRGVNARSQISMGYPDHWDARRLGIQFVLERCDEVIQFQPPLIVVADEMSRPEIHRRLVDSYRKNGTPGYRASRLRSVVDNIYFMPSHAARGIQAADLVANIHRRKFDPYQTKPDASTKANDQLWALLWASSKVRSYGIWPPK